MWAVITIQIWKTSLRFYTFHRSDSLTREKALVDKVQVCRIISDKIDSYCSHASGGEAVSTSCKSFAELTLNDKWRQYTDSLTQRTLSENNKVL